MIWLKQDDRLLGYVPSLKKEYPEAEIREMSKYHGMFEWSRLSKFIMAVQGIAYSYYCDEVDSYNVDATRLVDINTSFDFEAFYFSSNKNLPLYVQQISEVFSNLELIKVEERAICDLTEQISEIKQTFDGVLSARTFEQMERDITRIKMRAEDTSANLVKLKKLVENFGYYYPNNLFSEPKDNILVTMYFKRNAQYSLTMYD